MGLTVFVPPALQAVAVLQTVPKPGLRLQLVALLACQLRVLDCPALIDVGLALSVGMGAGVLPVPSTWAL